MSKKRTKYSTLKVVNQKGKIVCYLTKTDEENGLDIQYDLLGYKIITL